MDCLSSAAATIRKDLNTGHSTLAPVVATPVRRLLDWAEPKGGQEGMECCTSAEPADAQCEVFSWGPGRSRCVLCYTNAEFTSLDCSGDSSGEGASSAEPGSASSVHFIQGDSPVPSESFTNFTMSAPPQVSWTVGAFNLVGGIDPATGDDIDIFVILESHQVSRVVQTEDIDEVRAQLKMHHYESIHGDFYLVPPRDLWELNLKGLELGGRSLDDCQHWRLLHSEDGHILSLVHMRGNEAAALRSQDPVSPCRLLLLLLPFPRLLPMPPRRRRRRRRRLCSLGPWW